MRNPYLVMFFLFLLSFGAEGNNCHKNALNGLLNEHYPDRRITVTYNEFKTKEAVFKKVQNRPEYVQHLRGEFSYQKTGPMPQVKLESGLHTSEGLNFFREMRPDIANEIQVKVLHNGVQVASIPQSGFSNRRLRYLVTRTRTVNGKDIIFSDKTIFPSSWKEEDIVKAIEAVKNNQASFRKINDGATIVTGNYKNVKIRVIIRDGEVKTAFPLSN